jgi:hypothetical protein
MRQKFVCLHSVTAETTPPFRHFLSIAALLTKSVRREVATIRE